MLVFPFRGFQDTTPGAALNLRFVICPGQGLACVKLALAKGLTGGRPSSKPRVCCRPQRRRQPACRAFVDDVLGAPSRRPTANRGTRAGTLNRVNRPPSPAAMMSAPPRGRRRLLAAASVSVAALALAGCQWSAPLQTQRPYEPADGTSTTVGDVQVNNILVVAEKKGEPGTLVGLGVNGAAQPIEVSFLVGDGSARPPMSITIPAGGSKQISEVGDGAKTTVTAVPVDPGALIDLTVSTSGAGSNVIRVPVVQADGYYKGYAGGSATPTPTMSITGSPTSSPTKAPTQAPSAPATGETNPGVPEPAQNSTP